LGSSEQILAERRNVGAMSPAAPAAIDQQYGNGQHNHQKDDIRQIELHDSFSCARPGTCAAGTMINYEISLKISIVAHQPGPY